MSGHYAASRRGKILAATELYKASRQSRMPAIRSIRRTCKDYINKTKGACLKSYPLSSRSITRLANMTITNATKEKKSLSWWGSSVFFIA